MLHLAILSFLRRPLSRLLLLCIIAISTSLPVFLWQTAGGLYDGINRAVTPFPILAGTKGSSYQLVLNTVFFRDRPLGNMTKEEAQALEENPKVKAAYPLAFGDNYRGFPIIGTTKDLFQYQVNPKENAPWLSIQEGRLMEEEGDVVIGSETARLTGLQVGNTFHSIHGMSEKGHTHSHSHPCKVVGVLKPVKGPYDNAILTDIHDVWEAHGEAAEAKQEVTALLVVPKGYKEAMQLLGAYQKNKEVQLVFPSQSIISLYAMVGQTKDFWKMLTLFLIGVSLMVTLLVMYWSTLGRFSEIALLAAMGATKKAIGTFLLIEEICLLLSGTVIGWLLGYGGSLLAAKAIASHAAIVMDTAPNPLGLLLIPAITLIGALASLLPIWLLQKKNVADYL